MPITLIDITFFAFSLYIFIEMLFMIKKYVTQDMYHDIMSILSEILHWIQCKNDFLCVIYINIHA